MDARGLIGTDVGVRAERTPLCARWPPERQLRCVIGIRLVYADASAEASAREPYVICELPPAASIYVGWATTALVTL